MSATEYISLDALAASLGLPRTYLRRLATEKVIPALDVSGRLRFDEEAVRSALVRLSRRPVESSRQAVARG